MINRVRAGTVGLTMVTVLLALAPLTPVAAADTREVRKVEVRYGDLNLTSDLGARAMYDRLRSAARTVCGDVVGSYTRLGEAGRIRKCRKQSMDRAVGALNAPLVTALYDDRLGRAKVQLATR